MSGCNKEGIMQQDIRELTFKAVCVLIGIGALITGLVVLVTCTVRAC